MIEFCRLLAISFLFRIPIIAERITKPLSFGIKINTGKKPKLAYKNSFISHLY